MRFFICFFILLGGLSKAQDVQNFLQVNEKVNKLVTKFKNKNNIPGISVSISYKNRIIFSQGFGYADLDLKKGVNPSLTKFRIASISKTITSVTLAKLQEQGKVNFKESVYKYLDSLPKTFYDFTIEDLLSHKAGFVRDYGGSILCDKNDFHKVEFYKTFNNQRFSYKPKTNFNYSNYGYKLLGILIEHIYGNSIVEAKKELVIDYLGLKNTIAETNNYDENTSVFYYEKNGKLLKVPCLDCSFNYGPGCYLSTSEDLITLGNAYLYTGKLLSKESLSNLIKTRNTDKDYGLGFINKKDFYGNWFYGHNGSYPGALSYLRIYPKNELVVSVLMNYRTEEILSKFDILNNEIAYEYNQYLKK